MFAHSLRYRKQRRSSCRNLIVLFAFLAMMVGPIGANVVAANQTEVPVELVQADDVPTEEPTEESGGSWRFRTKLGKSPAPSPSSRAFAILPGSIRTAQCQRRGTGRELHQPLRRGHLSPWGTVRLRPDPDHTGGHARITISPPEALASPKRSRLVTAMVVPAPRHARTSAITTAVEGGMYGDILPGDRVAPASGTTCRSRRKPAGLSSPSISARPR